MKKSLFTYILGIIMILIGILVLLQASDLNPLLFIHGYREWVHDYSYLHYNEKNQGVSLLIILGIYCVGSLIIVSGFLISRPIRFEEGDKEKNKKQNT